MFLGRLVDEITYAFNSKANSGATPMAILGPFYRADAPVREKNSSIIVNNDGGQVVYMHGRVLNCVTKEPIKNALVQVWQASINGLYDQQDPKQTTGNLHGQFRSDENGEYALYCLKPTPYPIESKCEYHVPRINIAM
jgi:catechol 1,2-dioxygenase